MLQGAVDGVALRRPQLVEVGVDPLASFQLRLPVPSPQVAPYVFPRQHRLGDVVEHAGRDYIKEVGLYTDILDRALAHRTSRLDAPQAHRLAEAARRGSSRAAVVTLLQIPVAGRSIPKGHASGPTMA